MKRFWPVGVVLLLAVGVLPASADTLFFDNFDTENGGVGVLNYNSFAHFTISNGTVDLIGNGFSDFPPVTTGHGLYVDLEGSTSQAGLMLVTPIAVIPGSYALSFQLAGSQRGTTETVRVEVLVDNVAISFVTVVMDATVPFITIPAPISISVPGHIAFSFYNQGNDNIGALLDNVELTGPAQVPEPASLFLLGAGLVGLGRAWRKRRH